jgi:aryl-alcohol dehydrogenase-like predicted oxidoreductase
MDHVFLGSTGVRVSPLCLGTMSFGGEADEAEAGRIFARARDVGVNFFDCADVYWQGRSEEILGRLVAPCRDEVVVATKAYFPTSGDVNARGSSRYHLVRAVEASLRRLATDRIDVFYLHRFDDVTDLEDSLRTLELLVQQGKILYPAVSNFSAWQTARAVGIAERMGWAPIVCAQPMYNLAKRQAEVEILPMAQALRLGVCSYSPLGGGLLSGKYGPATRPQEGRLVANKMYATRYADESNYELAAAFGALATEAGVHPVSLAIAWVKAHQGITAPIVGARSVGQLEPSLAALEVDLTSDLYAAISALSATPPPATDRNEESSSFNFGRR